MKKVALGSLAALLVAAMLVTVLLVAGCGSKSTTKKAGSPAQQVLDKSQTKMQGIQSLKMAGKATILTPQSETKTDAVTYTAEMKVLSKSDVEMHMVASQSNGKKSEMYVVGGYLYSFDSAKGWTKEKVDTASQQQNFMTPSAMNNLTKYAENLKQGADQNGKYVISFDVGSKMFDQMLTQAAGTAQTTSPADKQATQQLMQSMRDMLSGLKMGVVYKIDKTTSLADGATIHMSMKGTPVIGDLTVDMAVTFTDYNVPVTITLPPEAQAAPEVQPNPSGIPNIPSIPGLGI